MNPLPTSNRLVSSFVAVFITLTAFPAAAHSGPTGLCSELFRPKEPVSERSQTLIFDPGSSESIIEAIATIPLSRLREPVSELMRPAEAFLRMHGDSPAKRTIVNRLNELIHHDGKRYTVEHSWAVAALAVRLAKSMGMGTEELVSIFYSGLAHDLGKAIVPDEVLNKPGRLTDEELAQMRRHAVALKLIMAERAKGDPELQSYVDIGGDHHERWDGKGYPVGKSGEDIALASRILGIVDTFHAMTSNRPYREGMPFPRVIDILTKEIQSGQFDPDVLQHFLIQVQSEVGTDLAR